MADDAVPTLAVYLDEWLDRRRAQLRPSTAHSYRQLVRAYLVPALGDLRLDELDRRLLETTYARLLDHGGMCGRSLSPTTVRYCHAVLRRALEDARLDGLLATNPADAARPPRHDPDEDEVDDDLRVWTGAQAATFLAHVDAHPWRGLWHLALGTGARRGELLGLRWTDVDLDAGQVRIRRSLTVVDGTPRLLGTKTSRSRVVQVGSSVVAALRAHGREQVRQRRDAEVWQDRWGLVFTEAAGTNLPPMHVTLAFRRLVRQAPVPVIRLHDLRHTHASLLLADGVPIKVVSERLGHATIAMTMDVYGHLLPGMDAEAADRFDRLVHDPGDRARDNRAS